MRWREGKLLRIINNYSSEQAWSIVRSDLIGFQALFQSSSAKPFASLLRIKVGIYPERTTESSPKHLCILAVHRLRQKVWFYWALFLLLFFFFWSKNWILLSTDFLCSFWMTTKAPAVAATKAPANPTLHWRAFLPLASTIAGPHSTAAGGRTKPAVTFLGERWPHNALWAEAWYEGVPQQFQASCHTSLFEINNFAICTCICCCSK